MLRREKKKQPEGDLLDLRAEIRGVRAELAQLNSHRFIRMHNSLWRVIAFNLARGLAFGLGTVMGASVLLSFIVWSLSQIEFLPIIGEWASEIARQMERAAE
ncbi:DUF5665 domain-containing protein [Roseovarius sp. SYSU LYC5161]|uniref:DUF5665 domain-containing protein n=1 Tax=Roseovarius halophilus (ex Wu et al. 2025) TaxID=3376060 RepID=UPI0039996C2B